MGSAYGYGSPGYGSWNGARYGMGYSDYGYPLYDYTSYGVYYPGKLFFDQVTAITNPPKEVKVKTKTYTANLRQAHIDGGCQMKADNCPGALAINEVVNPLGLWSHVGALSVTFTTEPGEENDLTNPPVFAINTPRMLSQFVGIYDREGADSVGPFSFEFELPADLRFHKVTLTGKEADTLRTVLASIGGNPSKSPRGHMSSLGKKLDNAGVPSWVDVAENDLKSGSIMFTEYENKADHPGQPW